jgi:Concanavalin A-like lectin/glucanases superfamily/SPRY domain
MQIVPVVDAFSQTLDVILGGQACTLNIYQKSTRNPAIGAQQGPSAGGAALGPAGPGISIQGNLAILTSLPAPTSGLPPGTGLRNVYEVAIATPTFATSATQTNAGALWPIVTGINPTGVHITDGCNYGSSFSQLRGDGNSYTYDIGAGAYQGAVPASAVQAAWGARSQNSVGPAGSGFAISRAGYGAFGTTEAKSVCFAPGVSAAVTVALLHFDGTNGSTAFTDSGAYSVAVTAAGTGVVETSNVKFGSGALDCGAQTGWVYLANHPSQEWGSADFTMSAWAYLTGTGGTGEYAIFSKQIDGSTPGAFHVKVDTGPNLYAYVSSVSSGWDYIIGPVNFPINTWHHVALVRHGTSLVLYLDGVASASTTLSSSSYSLYANPSVPVSVGCASAAGTGSFGGLKWNGQIDEFEMRTGARWTSNFTPPTAPFQSSSGGSDPNGGYLVVTSGYATGTATYQFDCLPCLAGNASVPLQFFVQGVYPCADGVHIVVLTANANDAAPLQWNILKVTGGAATLVAYGAVPSMYFPTIGALSGDFSDTSPNNTANFKGCLDADLQTLWLWEGGASANGLSILQLSGGTATLLYSTASVFANSGLLGPGAMLAVNGYGAFIRSNALALWTINAGTASTIPIQTARTYFGVASGSYYWEVQPTFINPTGLYRIGICTASFPLSGPVGIGSDTSAASVGWDYLGGIFYNGVQLALDGAYPYSVGDTLGFAFNATTGTLSMYRNGTFAFTLSGLAANTWFPAMSVSAIGSATVFNLGANSFTYTSPATFASLFADTSSSTDGPDALYLDLLVNDVPLVTGVVCQNLNRLVRLAYLGFTGDLIWQDTHGSSDPVSPGLGTRYQLCYLESTDPVPALP